MKKFLSLLVILVVIAAVGFSSYKGVALAQSENEIVQSGDLCGGTGGNGQIVSIGNNSFTLEHNDGRSMIVSLPDHATIETSIGFVSLSDLKIGDRVTLVGDDNRDGSFNADAVVVCSGTEETGTGQSTSINARKGDAAYKNISGLINVAMVFFVGLIWLSIAAFLRVKKKKSFVYLLFFTIFYIYLFKVLDYTLLQFQSLLLLQHFVPDLMLNGFKDGTSVNLIPLATLKLEDVNTSLLNILMMVPFGFGLPFITNFRMKKVVVIGLLLSIFIELLQFITGFMANTTFRVADINDLIFNTIGVAIGYALFVGLMRNFRRISRNWKITNPILRYIADRSQIDK